MSRLLDRWNIHWIRPVLGQSFRNALTYRFEFWFRFLGFILVDILIAYFLWKSIYGDSPARLIGGYDFKAMMFYSVVGPFLYNIVAQISMGLVAWDIYDGSLSRYLVYPMPYVPYKLLTNVPNLIIAAVQALIAVGLVAWIWGMPQGMEFSWLRLLAALSLSILGAACYASIILNLELVAFWADGVWSLATLVNISARLLGGITLPLTLFPDGARLILEKLPFASFGALPIRVFLGQATAQEYMSGLFILFGYTAVLFSTARFTYVIGLKKHTGVAM